MTAGRCRGQYPSALFWNGTAVDEPETRDNPRLRRCTWPNCRAAPGQPCTYRKNGRNVPRSGYHDARKATT